MFPSIAGLPDRGSAAAWLALPPMGTVTCRPITVTVPAEVVTAFDAAVERGETRSGVITTLMRDEIARRVGQSNAN